MRDLDQVSKRIEAARPDDVNRAWFNKSPVEVRIASLAHLDDEGVQICSVRVRDQLLNLSSRLDAVVEPVHPHRPVLRCAERDCRFGAW